MDPADCRKSDASGPEQIPQKTELRPVYLLQILYIVIALFGINDPFISAHYVRQTYTFDITRNVFRDGWRGLLYPKASDTREGGNLSQPFTISRAEFPFHGLFGMPAAAAFPHHQRAIARLVSVLFAVLSIRLCYLVLRHWLSPLPSLLGTALWATAPLVMHFGQVPMPDILCTAGIMAAFAFALRGRLAASSGCFLFALLAKPSVIFYGLPVLVALVLVCNCSGFKHFLRIALAWGICPFLALVAWLSLSLLDPPGSMSVVKGVESGHYGRIHLHELMTLKSWLLPVNFVFVFGCGVLGTMSLGFAFFERARRMNGCLKAAIAVALVSNYLLVALLWLEPQYSLPVLFWVIVAAALGIPAMLKRLGANGVGKIVLGTSAVLHLALVGLAVCFLKAPRVSNLLALQAAAQLTPPNARLIVCASTDCTTWPPPVWLDRNTFLLQNETVSAFPASPALVQDLERLHAAGFDYLIIFDLEKKHSRLPLSSLSHAPYATDLTAAASPVRQYCDQRFQKLYEGEHVLLYSLGQTSAQLSRFSD